MLQFALTTTERIYLERIDEALKDQKLVYEYLKNKIKKPLEKNKPSIKVWNETWASNYYPALLSAIIDCPKEKINIITILNSIPLHQKPLFLFFMKKLVEKNPESIANNTHKNLIFNLIGGIDYAFK